MKPIIFAAALAAAALTSPAARAGEFEYAGRVGIVYLDESGAPLLEIPAGPDGRRALEPGATVTVVAFGSAPGDEQRLVHAEVALGPLKSATTDRPLYFPGSGPVTASDKYALTGIDGAVLSGTIGLGVAGAGDRCRISNGAVQCDLEPGAAPQSFRVCASHEGLHFSVWSGKPLEGARRWHAYYYLGYDVEPDCTNGDY